MAQTKDQRWIFDTGTEVIDLRAFDGFEVTFDDPSEEQPGVGYSGLRQEPLSRLRLTISSSAMLWDPTKVQAIEKVLRRGERMKVLALEGIGDPLSVSSVADFYAFETLMQGAPKDLGNLIKVDLSTPSSYGAFISPRPAMATDSFWAYDMGPISGADRLRMSANEYPLCAVVYVPAVPTGLNSTHKLQIQAQWNDGTSRTATATVVDSAVAALRAGIYFVELRADPGDTSQEDVAWLDASERALPTSGMISVGWTGDGLSTVTDANRTICVGLAQRLRDGLT